MMLKYAAQRVRLMNLKKLTVTSDSEERFQPPPEKGHVTVEYDAAKVSP